MCRADVRARSRVFAPACLRAHMLGAALAGEVNLLLALGKAGALFVAHLVDAVRAGNARHIGGPGLVLIGDGPFAGMAHVIIAGREIVLHRDALVEDETLATPFALHVQLPQSRPPRPGR